MACRSTLFDFTCVAVVFIEVIRNARNHQELHSTHLVIFQINNEHSLDALDFLEPSYLKQLTHSLMDLNPYFILIIYLH